MNTVTTRTKTTRKGIEPIVAAILLIAIAIVAGVILYLWISRLVSSGTTNTSVVPAQMQVLDAYYSPTNKEIDIYVRSTITLQKSDIKTVIVYNSSGTLVKVIPSTNKGTNIGPRGPKPASQPKINVTPMGGEVYKITVSNVQLSSGVYYCEIVTTYGTIVTPTFTVTS